MDLVQNLFLFLGLLGIVSFDCFLKILHSILDILQILQDKLFIDNFHISNRVN